MPVTNSSVTNYKNKRQFDIVQSMSKFAQQKGPEETEEDWWENKTSIVREWLESNPLKIGIPDDETELTIIRQIDRGDKYEVARCKCWSHIVREIQDLPGVCDIVAQDVEYISPRDPEVHPNVSESIASDDAAQATTVPVIDPMSENNGQVSPSRGKIRPGKTPVNYTISDKNIKKNDKDRGESRDLADDIENIKTERSIPSNDTECITSPTGNCKEEKATEKRKSLSSMSMMDRQAEWLKRKEEKKALEKERQEQEATKELTFQPKMMSKTKSWGSSRGRIQSTTSIDSEVDKKKSTPPPAKRSDSLKDVMAKKKPNPRPITTNETKKPQNKPPKRKSINGKSVTDSPGSLLEISKENLKNSAKVNHDISDESDVLQAEAESAEEVNEQTTPIMTTINSKPIDFSFDSGSTDSKGRFRLRDAAEFELHSLYRKTDKKAGRAGISLQMGRREDTNEEQVVAIFFDRDKITEAESREWWGANQQRFIDSNC